MPVSMPASNESTHEGSPSPGFSGLGWWAWSQCLGWTGGLIVLLFLGLVGTNPNPQLVLRVIAGLIFLSFTMLAYRLSTRFSVANAVTILRISGVCVVLWLVAAGVVQILWAPVFLALLALCDMADGWCARKYGSTEAGALLDMEADQLTILGMASFAHLMAGLSPVVLLLPLFKTAFGLWHLLQGFSPLDPKPRDGDNRVAKTICALVVVLLLVACAVSFPRWLREIAVTLAVLLLSFSFAGDALWLIRARSARNAALRR